jgi:hypothetical protein
MGGALAYNSTHSAVCFTIVSGHVCGGRSSAAQYHPLRTRHASFMALLLRWLSTVDAALAARCLRYTASEDLISRPILQAAARGRLPILLSVTHWLITFQDLSKIHWLAGRSLLGKGLRQGVIPCKLPRALYRVPGGCGGGNVHIAINISSFPPPPLRKFWQQECDGWSHDKKAFGRLCTKIFLGWLPSPGYSQIVKRPSVSPSSSATSIGHGNFFPGIDGSGWTCQPSSWCLPVWQLSRLAHRAGQGG